MQISETLVQVTAVAVVVSGLALVCVIVFAVRTALSVASLLRQAAPLRRKLVALHAAGGEALAASKAELKVIRAGLDSNVEIARRIGSRTEAFTQETGPRIAAELHRLRLVSLELAGTANTIASAAARVSLYSSVAAQGARSSIRLWRAIQGG